MIGGQVKVDNNLAFPLGVIGYRLSGGMGSGGAEIIRRALGNMKMGRRRPLWLDTLQRIPPVTFSLPSYIRQTKPGRIPKPPSLRYPEDEYKARFFKDHPMETLRPTTMDERASRRDAD